MLVVCVCVCVCGEGEGVGGRTGLLYPNIYYARGAGNNIIIVQFRHVHTMIVLAHNMALTSNL